MATFFIAAHLAIDEFDALNFAKLTLNLIAENVLKSQAKNNAHGHPNRRSRLHFKRFFHDECNQISNGIFSVLGQVTLFAPTVVCIVARCYAR